MFALALSSSTCFGQTRAEQHIELRVTLQQWMEAMDRLQALEEQWQFEKVVLKDSLGGLREMVAQSEVGINEVEKRLEAVDQESQEKLEQQRAFDNAREALREGLAPVEAEVAQVAPLFPDFYVHGDDGSSKLKASLELLAEHRRAEPEEKERLGLNRRIQPLVQILTEAERFQSKLWAVTHPLKVGEVEKQMNVLYFGLSIAYAVDTGATVALEGRSSPEGWKFTEMSGEGVAARVLTLYQAADGSGESQMVNLPLTLD